MAGPSAAERALRNGRFPEERRYDPVGTKDLHQGSRYLDDGWWRIIASFLDEGEIDEFSIHVIPIFIGEGIPLIKPQHRFIPLELLSTQKFPDGVVHLNYRVLPHPGNKIAH